MVTIVTRAGKGAELTYAEMDANFVNLNTKLDSGHLAGLRNILINGEVTRINQRGVANWDAVANGAYGYDRWKKVDASNMTQIVEAGNYKPSTVHTLSGIGVTTQQITSPASGNWTLPNIPITATNVQLESGSIATPFERRPVGLELSLCQRYLPAYNSVGTNDYFASGQCISTTGGKMLYLYKVPPRIKPTGVIVSNAGYFYVTVSNGGTIACTGLSYGSDSSIDAASLLCSVAGGLTAGNAVLIQSASTSAQLLFTGCEL